MHATYLFYAPNADIDAVVEGFTEWIERNGDENNWYELLCAINSHGETRELATRGDWRGRALLASKLLSVRYTTEPTPEKIAGALHGKTTFEDFKVFAWVIAGYEVCFCLERDDPALSFFSERGIARLYPNVRRPFLEKLLEVVRREYNKARVDLEKNWMMSYRRRRLALIFENLKSARNPPFIDEGTPYDFRCFDLTGWVDEGPGECILAVDIHT